MHLDHIQVIARDDLPFHGQRQFRCAFTSKNDFARGSKAFEQALPPSQVGLRNRVRDDASKGKRSGVERHVEPSLDLTGNVMWKARDE